MRLDVQEATRYLLNKHLDTLLDVDMSDAQRRERLFDRIDNAITRVAGEGGEAEGVAGGEEGEEEGAAGGEEEEEQEAGVGGGVRSRDGDDEEAEDAGGGEKEEDR